MAENVRNSELKKDNELCGFTKQNQKDTPMSISDDC